MSSIKEPNCIEEASCIRAITIGRWAQRGWKLTDKVAKGSFGSAAHCKDHTADSCILIEIKQNVTASLAQTVLF